MESNICPKCGKPYTEPSALSRKDNKTEICPDCGIREAMEIAGFSESQQEELIEILHKHTKEN